MILCFRVSAFMYILIILNTVYVDYATQIRFVQDAFVNFVSFIIIFALIFPCVTSTLTQISPPILTNYLPLTLITSLRTYIHSLLTHYSHTFSTHILYLLTHFSLISYH